MVIPTTLIIETIQKRKSLFGNLGKHGPNEGGLSKQIQQ